MCCRSGSRAARVKLAGERGSWLPRQRGGRLLGDPPSHKGHASQRDANRTTLQQPTPARLGSGRKLRDLSDANSRRHIHRSQREGTPGAAASKGLTAESAVLPPLMLQRVCKWVCTHRCPDQGPWRQGDRGPGERGPGGLSGVAGPHRPPCLSPAKQQRGQGGLRVPSPHPSRATVSWCRHDFFLSTWDRAPPSPGKGRTGFRPQCLVLSAWQTCGHEATALPAQAGLCGKRDPRSCQLEFRGQPQRGQHRMHTTQRKTQTRCSGPRHPFR